MFKIGRLISIAASLSILVGNRLKSDYERIQGEQNILAYYPEINLCDIHAIYVSVN